MAAVNGPEVTTKGVVIRIDAGVATLLVGEEQEEWDFPTRLLPDEVTEDSVVLLTGEGYGLQVVGMSAERVDTVESRLSRGVNRLRLEHIA